MNSIDLHGLSLAEAHEKLETGLRSALQRQEYLVRIIHGQGKHSEVFPVIKSFVRRWLKESEFALLHIESVFPGEEGTPFTSANPGETIVVLRGARVPVSKKEPDFFEEEYEEARRNAKRLRADKLRTLRRRKPRPLKNF
ncbi:MAG: Smr/MutS family protein [Firmicutes bacterium]|nr:Smr/MutS family protein [Bacillota bacterium]